MSEENIRAEGHAIAAYHLAIATLQALTVKGLLSADEVQMALDSALIGAEAGPSTPGNQSARRSLELVARVLRNAAPGSRPAP